VRPLINLARLLFALVGLWVVFDPGCGTLPELIHHASALPFALCAGLVSVVAALLGVLSVLPVGRSPVEPPGVRRPQPAEDLGIEGMSF